jgi:hydroxymethylbilane synthase
LDPIDVLPQAGQGAIAVQCRADDDATLELLAAIDDESSHRALRAERSVLAGLGGNCSVPVGAWAEVSPGEPGLLLHGLAATADGRTVIRLSRHGEDQESLGTEVARALLIDHGASGLDGFESALDALALPSGTP